MKSSETTFALFYGNRGFFPASLIAEARSELPRILKEMGHDSIALHPGATRHGAVAAPQRHGITMETIDPSEVMKRVSSVSVSNDAYNEKSNVLKDYTSWTGVPEKSFENIVRLGLEGHRHHVSITPGSVAAPVREALERYIRCTVAEPQRGVAEPQRGVAEPQRAEPRL